VPITLQNSEQQMQRLAEVSQTILFCGLQGSEWTEMGSMCLLQSTQKLDMSLPSRHHTSINHIDRSQ
jgi:hypothetical protein